MRVAQLMASPFVGGPEKQVLGLAAHLLPAGCRTIFLSFSESGRARPFLDEASQQGWDAVELVENWPHWRRAAREIADHLKSHRIEVLCTNGYKPDLIGYAAARRAGVPVVAIAHGWTGATRKVRLNEMVDRWILRRFDCVVSVSEAQAAKVARAGVSRTRMMTILNAVPPASCGRSPARRAELESLFPQSPRLIVAAAGRLSPEKGFDVFVDMAGRIAGDMTDVGFAIFGEGPLRDQLAADIRTRGLQDRVVLAGFRSDLCELLPQLDVLVLSSRTEGLPVVLLEAMAADVPVVATSVGGVPEVIEDGRCGLLVPPDDPNALTHAVGQLAADAAMRQQLGRAGAQRVAERFSQAEQAQRYYEVFARLLAARA
ncbi:MAG TPA: glycosyltransferase [Lacipirellulaceae bacterium]|nr:glycosyltransferase [Lacipirellulaceae bacterium]